MEHGNFLSFMHEDITYVIKINQVTQENKLYKTYIIEQWNQCQVHGLLRKITTTAKDPCQQNNQCNLSAMVTQQYKHGITTEN